MNYIRLSNLTNRYPQTGNYIPQKTGDSTLFGIYEETNRIDFKLSDFSEVIPIDGVSARFIFAVTYDNSLSVVVDNDDNQIESKLDVNNQSSIDTITPNDTPIDKFINSSNASKRKKKKTLLGKIARAALATASIVTGVGVAAVVASAVAGGIKRNEIRKKRNARLLDRYNTESESTNTNLNPLENVLDRLRNNSLARKNQRRDRIFGLNQTVQNSSLNTPKPELVGDDNKTKVRIFSDLKVNNLENTVTKLFCSKEYFQNLTSAKLAGNPYFINFSFKPEFLVEINTIPLVELFDSFLDLELNNGVLMKRNNYISDGNIDFEKLVKYVDWVVSKPTLADIDTNGVIPSNLLCEYERGEFDKKTGKWNTAVSQESNTTQSDTSTQTTSSEYPPVGRIGNYTGENVDVDGDTYAWTGTIWRPVRPTNQNGNSGGSNYGGGGGDDGRDRRGMR